MAAALVEVAEDLGPDGSWRRKRKGSTTRPDEPEPLRVISTRDPRPDWTKALQMCSHGAWSCEARLRLMIRACAGCQFVLSLIRRLYLSFGIDHGRVAV